MEGVAERRVDVGGRVGVWLVGGPVHDSYCARRLIGNVVCVKVRVVVVGMVVVVNSVAVVGVTVVKVIVV